MKSITKKLVYHFSRILPDIILSGMLLYFYLVGNYAYFSPTIQTIALKATLVSLGFIHAHLVQALLFPDIDWRRDDVDKIEKIRAVILYAVFVYCYSVGG